MDQMDDGSRASDWRTISAGDRGRRVLAESSDGEVALIMPAGDVDWRGREVVEDRDALDICV